VNERRIFRGFEPGLATLASRYFVAIAVVMPTLNISAPSSQ
jgi:hypothetical protein